MDFAKTLCLIRMYRFVENRYNLTQLKIFVSSYTTKKLSCWVRLFNTKSRPVDGCANNSGSRAT
jgi:hypothetical protein